MKALLAIFGLVISINSFAAFLPKVNPVPGGVAIVPLVGLTSTSRPNAFYRSERVMVLSSKGTDYAVNADWIAIVGIPLKVNPAKKQHLRANATSFYFHLKSKQYKAQYLTVKNKRHVNPDPADIARWRKEKKEMTTAFQSWNTSQPPALNFSLPAPGRFSSPFGLKRFFNKQPRNPHSGLDIAAPTGTPVVAPAMGKVVAVGNYFFNGKTVIVDHGHGLTTMYCHLSEIIAKPGQILKRGELLGKVGKTGRVTGAHLHWGVSMNNTRVDPLLFVKN